MGLAASGAVSVGSNPTGGAHPLSAKGPADQGESCLAVTLPRSDADQRSSRKIIGEARDRLESALQRARDARDTRLKWHARLFFRSQVLSAASKGSSDPAELMRLDEGWPFTAEELEPYATEVAEEFARAKATQPIENRGSGSRFQKRTGTRLRGTA